MHIEQFEKNLNLHFFNKKILETALTHTSYAYENHVDSNEKLEFLGDAILEFVISHFLFDNYKNLSEGEMTKVRATAVCEESLYEIACKHNFSDFLNLGKSEANGEKTKKAILADSVEAVIAAIFLDSGLEKAKDFILKNLKDTIHVATKNVGKKDYKTVLQEKLQVNGDIEIKYTTIKEEGPDHDKIFTVELTVNGKKISIGKGHNKKEAEMKAAEIALQIYNKQ